MVTNEMVKRAATEYLSHKGERPYRVTRRGAELWEDHAPALRAALEAALTAAESETNNAGSKCEPLERSCTFDLDNDPKKENVYPAPPAPSVAVKALEALPGITGFGASFNRDKDAWVLYTTPSCDRFGQIDGFNPKVIDWILEVLRSALSAQVQDVAGWQPLETAPKDGSTFIALASKGLLTHWMPPPAALSKQEASHVTSK
jgi:hypothetical protein